MDIMRAIRQHPRETREIGEPGQKRARDVREAEVGLRGMDEQYYKGDK